MAKARANIKELEANLNRELTKLEDAIQILNDDFKLIQKGSKKGPYWNGANAYASMKANLANLDHNKVLLKNLKKCDNFIKKMSITKKNS